MCVSSGRRGGGSLQVVVVSLIFSSSECSQTTRILRSESSNQVRLDAVVCS